MSKCVKNNKSVLLVGANLRAMFFVARKLWQSEWVVDVVDFEPIPIQNSKYIRKYYKLEQDNNLDNLADKIIDVVKGVGYDVVIPINDVGVLVCNTFNDKFKDYSKIILPNNEIVEYSRNKYKLFELSIKCGFSNPETIYVQDKEKLVDILENIPNGSIVAKSCSSKKVCDGTIKSYSVYKTEDKRDLIDRFCDETEFPIMIQKYVQGTEIGYNFYAEDGIVKTSYFDRFFRGNFGEECMSRQSIDFDNELAHKLNALIEKIEWDGVGMFDLILHDDEVFILELNGRFWASVDLSEKINSGIWELYSNKYLKTNLIVPTRSNNIVTIINAISVNKKIIRNIIGFKGLMEDLRLIYDILRSVFSRNYYIQECLWANSKFYRKLFLHYLKKIFVHG